MKIHFVGHACIVVECGGNFILTDPWFSGKVFNESWTLRPEPRCDPSLLDRIDHLWISHEHPDHCHFPTLEKFSASFKRRVRVLFQKRNEEKVIAAFRAAGYEQFRLLPHRTPVALGEESAHATKVYCYHAGLIDSALAIAGDGQVILNANDARISAGECAAIRRDLGRVDVVLNQFSLAAYAGFEPPENYLPARAQRLLQYLSAVHQALGARVTVPFASFIYFSTRDNKYVNRFSNSVSDASRYLGENRQRAVVLYPGDSYEVGSAHDSSEALERYAALPGWEDLAYDCAASKPLSEVFQAYRELAARIRERYSQSLLRLLYPVTIRIPDLGSTIVFRLADESIQTVADSKPPDLIINSQPLWFGFAFPWGIQTLGVSARFRLLRHPGNWKMHRMLFSLNNSGLYLRPKYVLTPDFVRDARSRLAGGLRQAVHYYRTSL